MANQAILEFIAEQRKLGVPDEKIRDALFANGWKADLVHEAFNPQPAVHPVTGHVAPAGQVLTATSTNTPAEPKPDEPQLVPVSQVYGAQATPTATTTTSTTVETAPGTTQATTAPAPSSPEAVQAPLSTPTTPPRNNVMSKVVFGLIAVLVILSAGGFAAYSYYQSMPAVIMQKMFANASTIKTSNFTGTATVHAYLDKVQEVTMEDHTNPVAPLAGSMLDEKTESITTVQFTSISDVTDPNHIEGEYGFVISSDAFAQQPELINFQMKLTNDIFYLNVAELPESIMAYIDPSFLNQWIKIDPQAANRGFAEPEEPKTLTEEQLNEIAEVWEKSGVLKITGKLPSEVLHGVATHHLGFGIDEAAFKTAVLQTYDIAGTENFSEAEKVRLADNIDEALQAIEFSEGEIWIGSRDYFVHKLQLKVTMSDPDTQKLLGYMTMVAEMQDHNQPVTIVAPPDAIDVEELMSNMISSGAYGGAYDGTSYGGDFSTMSEPQKQAVDTARLTDAEQLIAAIDRFRAFHGYFPWFTNSTETGVLKPTLVNSGLTWLDSGTTTPCPVLEKLSQATWPGCQGYDELSSSFVDRITNHDSPSMVVYNPGTDNTYVCFQPFSSEYRSLAEAKCGDSTGSNLPGEIEASIKNNLCAGYDDPSKPLMYCY